MRKLAPRIQFRSIDRLRASAESSLRSGPSEGHAEVIEVRLVQLYQDFETVKKRKEEARKAMEHLYDELRDHSHPSQSTESSLSSISPGWSPRLDRSETSRASGSSIASPASIFERNARAPSEEGPGSPRRAVGSYGRSSAMSRSPWSRRRGSSAPTTTTSVRSKRWSGPRP